MDVVYVSNEAYARHLCVSLCSLCDSNQDEDALRFYVISTGISPGSEEKIRETAASFDREVRFLPFSDLRERLGAADTGPFDVSTMGRLFLGEILPEELTRVLYLDCDTVVLRPLHRLWRTGLKGCVLGAVEEPTIYPEVREYLDLAANEPYFNAGVLLIDLGKWRADNVQSRVLEYYKRIGSRALFNDQDALNGLLRGRIRELLPKWNFFTNYRYFRYSTLVERSPSYSLIPRESFCAAKRHPAVVHYAGDERPWRAGARNPYGAAYERYLEMTPWAGTPKEKGYEREMFLYHGMNLCTALFPGLREAAGSRYVQKLIRERAERAEGAEGTGNAAGAGCAERGDA